MSCQAAVAGSCVLTTTCVRSCTDISCAGVLSLSRRCATTVASRRVRRRSTRRTTPVSSRRPPSRCRSLPSWPPAGPSDSSRRTAPARRRRPSSTRLTRTDTCVRRTHDSLFILYSPPLWGDGIPFPSVSVSPLPSLSSRLEVGPHCG